MFMIDARWNQKYKTKISHSNLNPKPCELSHLQIHKRVKHILNQVISFFQIQDGFNSEFQSDFIFYLHCYCIIIQFQVQFQNHITSRLQF